MSNTTTTDPFVNTLNIIQTNITLYPYLIIFIFGNIGSFLNVLVLIQKNYRQNSCSSYILASTIANLIMLNIIILFRILTVFSIDPTKTSWFFCKFRAYITQTSTTLSRTYILLACIDRWAMTSRTVAIRAFARIKIAKILIPSSSFIWCVSFIHVPLYQNIIKGRCILTSDSYIMFYNIYNAILAGLLFPIGMIICAILTIQNIKQLQHRAKNGINVNEPTVQPNTASKKKYDQQFILMMLIQQVVYVITNLPLASYLLYVAFTVNVVKSNVQTALDSLYMTVAFLLTYFNFAGTFYLYVLTSSIFRKDLKQLLFHNRFLNKWFGIHPNTQTVAAANS